MYSNAASQQTQIDSLFSNAAGQQTQINTLFANAASQAVDINTLFSNQTTLQNEITAANLNIATLDANLGAFEIYSNANAASQAISINTINANVTAANLAIANLSANLGAFEIYANTTFITSSSAYSNVNVAAYLPTYTGSLANSSTIIDLYANAATQAVAINTINANLGAFETYSNANVGSIYNQLNTLNANVGAFETYSNANVGSIYNQLNTLNANVGAFETYANATFITSSSAYSNVNVAAYLPTYTGSLANSSTIIDLYSNAATQAVAINTLNANLGAYQTYSNLTNAATQANIGTLFLGNASTQANLGAYQIYANANAATQAVAINTLNANVGAFELYANATFGPGAAGFYSNSNVAAYLPIYGGNIAATVTTAQQPYIQRIGANNNNSVAQILGGNAVIIIANAGPSFSNAGGVQIIAGNTQVKNSGTFYAEASKFFFQSHNGNNNGNDVSDYMKITVPAAVYGQFQQTSTEFGANTFSVYDGNVYIGPSDNPVAGSGILRVDNRILVGTATTINTSAVSTGTITATGALSALTITASSVATTNYLSAANFVSANSFQYPNGQPYSTSNLITYTGNIGNVSMTTGRRYFYSGNVDIIANGGSVDGVINLIAGNTATNDSGVIQIDADYVGLGSARSGAQIALTNDTTITYAGAASATANVLTVTGNINVQNAQYSGWIYGKYFIGDGGLLTNVATSYGNTQVSAFLPTYTGNIGATITDGTQPYIYDIGSILNATSVRGAGVSILGTGSNITLNTGNASAYVNNINGKFRSTTNVEVTSGAYFIGDGSQLTGLSSNYGNTQVAAYLPTFSGNIGGTLTTAAQPYVTSVGTLTSLAVTGNVTTGNISGTKGTFTTVQGTLITAAQTNITSVGTLSAVTVTGAATVGNVITTNGVFWSNGVAYSSGGGSYGNVEVAAYLPTYTGALAYSSQTANVNYNNQYISNAILGTTREKTIALGVIQGTVNIDANSGPIQTATVTANITINTNNLLNLDAGESITLVLTQNTNANLRVLTSNIKFAAGSKLLSTANAAIDTISITYDGTNYLASLVKGYA